MDYTLITGASGGLGKEIVSRLAVQGPLLLHGRDEARLNAIAREAGCRHPHRVWAHDFRSADAISSSIERFLTENRITVGKFVHAAGLAIVHPARGAMLQMTQECFSVNVISAQQIVGSLLKKRVNNTALNCVVFISSIYSRFGVRGHSTYCASKAALDGLMRALAIELAPTTRVNSIMPGALDTPMAAEFLGDPRTLGIVQRDYPLGIGRPSYAADAVAFLISEQAAWITGQAITVDGGRTAGVALT